jgi:hypothetical protein
MCAPFSQGRRWHIFKPKIPIWINLGGLCNRRCWYIIRPFGPIFVQPFGLFLWPFGIFYGYLIHFTILICCTKKNLATLLSLKTSSTGCPNWDQCYDFLNIFAKFCGEKIGVFDSKQS